MILWMKMAFKKLQNNRKKTMIKVLFLGSLYAIIFTLAMFLAGSEEQMSLIYRKFSGDVKFTDKNEDTSIKEVLDFIDSNFDSKLEVVIPGITMTTEVSSSSSYIDTRCIGVTKDFYKYVNNSVGWISKGLNILEPGYVSIEAQLAKSLNVKKGDILTIKYSGTEEYEMINTVDVEIDGIYIGSKLIYENSLLLSLEDMVYLTMDDNYLNTIRLYFKNDIDLEQMREITSIIKKSFSKIISVESATLDPTGGVMGIFKYYKMLLTFILGLIIIIFIIILNFSNQNIFFMEFRGRKAELSTLLTYGIKRGELKIILFFESLYLFVFSIIYSVLLSFGIVNILKSFEVNSLGMGDIITAIGGPQLIFILNTNNIVFIMVLLLIITIYSAQKGANSYIKMEVREIITTSN